MKRRVGAGRDRALDILFAEGAFPQNVVIPYDRSGKSGDRSLRAQRVEILPETAEDEIFGADRHPDAKDGHNRQERQKQAAHHMSRGSRLLMIAQLTSADWKNARPSFCTLKNPPTNVWVREGSVREGV